MWPNFTKKILKNRQIPDFFFNFYFFSQNNQNEFSNLNIGWNRDFSIRYAQSRILSKTWKFVQSVRISPFILWWPRLEVKSHILLTTWREEGNAKAIIKIVVEWPTYTWNGRSKPLLRRWHFSLIFTVRSLFYYSFLPSYTLKYN